MINNSETKEISAEFNRYPLKFFEKNNLIKNTCFNCGISFWHTTNRRLCGDNDCRRVEEKIPIKLATLNLPADQIIHHFMEYFSNERIPIRRASSVTRRGYHQFTCAGICAFRPLVHNPETLPVNTNKLVNAQYCFRFADQEHVGQTNRHSSGFIMLGIHEFENSKNKFSSSWKEDIVEELTNFFLHLGFELDDLTFHASYWTDNHLCAGPAIEFFINGIEIGNVVMVSREVNNISSNFVDVGIGLERLQGLFGHSSVYTNDVLNNNLRLIAVATKDFAYPGKSGLGFNIRKVLEEVINKKYSYEVLEPLMTVILSELSDTFGEDYKVVLPIFKQLYNEQTARVS